MIWVKLILGGGCEDTGEREHPQIVRNLQEREDARGVTMPGLLTLARQIQIFIHICTRIPYPEASFTSCSSHESPSWRRAQSVRLHLNTPNSARDATSVTAGAQLVAVSVSECAGTGVHIAIQDVERAARKRYCVL